MLSSGSLIGSSVSGSDTHSFSGSSVWVAIDTFCTKFTCTSTISVGAARAFSVCVATVAVRRCLTFCTTFSVTLNQLLLRSVSRLV